MYEHTETHIKNLRRRHTRSYLQAFALSSRSDNQMTKGRKTYFSVYVLLRNLDVWHRNAMLL